MNEKFRKLRLGLVAAGALTLASVACGGTSSRSNESSSINPANPLVNIPDISVVDKFKCDSSEDQLIKNVYLKENQEYKFDALRIFVKNKKNTTEIGELDGPGRSENVIRKPDEPPYIVFDNNWLFKNKEGGFGEITVSVLPDGYDANNRHIRLVVDCTRKEHPNSIPLLPSVPDIPGLKI